MPEIMMDVNGWQGLFEFATGAPAEEAGKDYLDIPKKICAAHPYPGDANPASVEWTTDVALEICREYDPRLMVLSYATGNIMRSHTVMTDAEQKEISRRIISESFRFAREGGYEPVIVTTGNLQKLNKVLNTENIQGYMSESPDRYMSGIFKPTESDMEIVKSWEGVTYEKKEDFLKRYGITEQYAVDRTPDVILYSEADTVFTRTGSRGLPFYMTAKKEDSCLCYTDLPDLPDSIFGFRSWVDGYLDAGRRIAVIIAESIDDEDMPAGVKRMSKVKNGIYYAEKLTFYYALLNSKEFFEPGMPYIFHNQFLRRELDRHNPFSYVKTERYQNPIGYNKPYRTAAMGTRSGILHSATMCDYSFECHCRGMAESGLLVFINSEKLQIAESEKQ